MQLDSGCASAWELAEYACFAASPALLHCVLMGISKAAMPVFLLYYSSRTAAQPAADRLSGRQKMAWTRRCLINKSNTFWLWERPA